MKRKYPAKLFWFGLFSNFMIRSFYLFLPGLILCIIGIWVKVCLWIGLALLGIDLLINLVDQIRIRQTALTPSDNPEFNELMEALTGPGGLDAFGQMLDERIRTTPPVEVPNEETEDA